MIIRKTRNVSCKPEFDAFIDSTIASGLYRGASEVIRAALRLLHERERRAQRQTKRTANASPPGH
ncbi:type II toxin-antitoxin system ParD family antitoxin [Microvirga arabica]|uniref:type II toxin-antitoxin system ParD family antitoxin n=1 Tax=Microvirga arabica TaxID=1128671 RepID=UPI00193A919B|nr:type II toxin-antitoxin system ParD family antitoxin [Microvirga arabica]MBM1169967.1 type II toxin-antitoxin system ParD family antitoxin [Microvirga arabica]